MSYAFLIQIFKSFFTAAAIALMAAIFTLSVFANISRYLRPYENNYWVFNISLFVFWLVWVFSFAHLIQIK